MLQKTTRTLALVVVSALIVAGCGDDDESTAPNPTAAVDEAAGSEADASDGSGDSGDSTDSGDSGDAGESGGSSSGVGSGSLDLDGETIELDRVRCHLESQPAAAGGGNILFVIQGEGEDSQGEGVMIDISRYDSESTFAGDSVDVYVGDYMAGDARGYSVMAPVGSVELDGSTASADGLTLEDAETGAPKTASFTIEC